MSLIRFISITIGVSCCLLFSSAFAISTTISCPQSLKKVTCPDMGVPGMFCYQGTTRFGTQPLTFTSNYDPRFADTAAVITANGTLAITYYDRPVIECDYAYKNISFQAAVTDVDILNSIFQKYTIDSISPKSIYNYFKDNPNASLTCPNNICQLFPVSQSEFR